MILVAVGPDGEPEGFISVWAADRFIHHLYVRSSSRRKGIGRALLAALEERMPKPWRLKCLRANSDATAFYMAQGWREISSDTNEEGAFAMLERPTDVQIVATGEVYAESFHAAVDYVARERRYIGFVEAPPVESTREFLRRLADGAGVQFLAIAPENRVVGWCDIIRNPVEGFRHVGRLGMGLLPEYRRRGLGRQLALKAIEAARGAGIERVELEVFATNEAAIGLYRSLGFNTEGIKSKARKLDGRYEDNVLMALISSSPSAR